MFPTSFFPVDYYTPSYWPREQEQAVGGRAGFRGAGKRLSHYLLAMMKDVERERAERQAVADTILRRMVAQQNEWQLAIEHLQRQSTAAAWTMILAEV